MLKSIIRAIGGDPNKRDIQKYSQVVERINALEPQFKGLTDAELRARTDQFRARLAGELGGITDPKERDQISRAVLDEVLPEAFATVREASMRALGLRHYDVQLIGGIVLHQGKIAEMRTGEGKTLVSTLALYLNALEGRGAHLITVNDYLARRDAKWMGPIFHLLGMSVGVLQEAARTENGKKAFLYDPEREAAQEDVDRLRMVDRREAYAADITYGTNNEFGFDYLRDNMAMRLEDRVQRERRFAIVDEVDNILIDEARTPLIISGPAQEDPALYQQMARVVRQLQPGDFEVDERNRSIALTELGEERIERVLGVPLRDPDRPEDITPEQARLLGHVEQALRAEYIYKRNKDYLVQAGKVVIVDEFTGRLMPGRRWSDGLHQAVEAKEGVPVQAENVTYATITLQNYFRLYGKLAGMTGTALTEAEEFSKIYKLEVVAIPPHLEYMATRPGSTLVEVEFKEDGSKFSYFAGRAEPDAPVYWRRKDYPDVVFRTEEAKLRSGTSEVLARHVRGQPLLIGTTSVESSERLALRFKAERLQRLAQALVLRHAWFEKHNQEEDGRRVDELEFMNKPLEDLTPGELRPLAKGLGISLNPETDENITRLARVLGLPSDDAEIRERLVNCLRAGLRPNVLNAKYHTEESQIIAGAGALGAITIATNMAGRGVDIKLGGELAEEVIAAVNRVLKRAGHPNPYDLNMEERRKALEQASPEAVGIYEAEVNLFRQYVQDEVRVKEAGGLHVIGSERHEARRIDNQLRGRAARQGDPGSSQFFLSLEDELMRRFGGSQVSDLMQRLKIDDAVPIAHGLVNKTIEQSQTRVEGSNFDVRKHLLEYDDVLNTQRNKIYEQRDRIFAKEDLAEDLGAMLEQEVRRRVPQALADDDGPWKLLAWLEETQPSLPLDETRVYPSYLLRVLLGDLEGVADPDSARRALVGVARSALEAERTHLLDAVETQIERTAERAESQIKERREMAELAIEGAEAEAETTGTPVDPRQLANAVGQAVGIDMRLDGKALQEAAGDLHRFKERLVEVAGATVPARLRASLIAAVERRVGGPLNLPRDVGMDFDWDDEGDAILAASEKAHQDKAERVLAEIDRELAEVLSRAAAITPDLLVRWLIAMAYGRQMAFDQRTHQRVEVRTQRLTYVYYAAQKIGDESADELIEAVLEHLRGAWDALRELTGAAEVQRLGGRRLTELPENLQASLRRALSDEAFESLSGQPIGTLGPEWLAPIRLELGRRSLNAAHRHLMLSVSTQLWVEYLTSVEALRTSIGLEAYGQRDPLVQYKSKAYDMFQELLTNMRAATVARMFTSRGAAREVPEARPAPAAALAAPARPAVVVAGNGGAKPQPPPAAGKAPSGLGRNDLCWCGSGKKYKHCHLDADRAASAPVVSGEAVAPSAGGKRRRRR